MARKSGSTISQEELYPHSDEHVREELDDARLLDLDAEQESPFLRGQKRVSVRRGTIPKKTATGLAWTALAICVAFFCMAGVAALYHYGEHSWRFRIESSDDIDVSGIHNVTRAQVMEIMGGDIGRNIFFIPLARRKAQLEQIPWVRSASVMRFAPNHIAVQIVERIPVAFARIGSKIFLIDEVGTPMDLPTGRNKFSFPVILGMNANEPPSTRKARMKIYNELVSQLDSDGAHYSQDLSEVDLSDLDDVKVLAANADGDVLVHLGRSKYLDRYKIYVAHVKEWRQQFEKVESVDLRYDRQIIVNPDSEGAVKQATISTSAARKAIAASVKPVAFVSQETAQPKTTTSATTQHSGTRLKPAVQRKMIRRGHRSGPHRMILASKRTKTVNKTQNTQAIQRAPQESVTVATKKKPSPSIAKQQ
ncbi:MAG: cell division protein FtsQ/DivIB [Terriglobales bacterium]|jgi:cell division protein FtsQ